MTDRRDRVGLGPALVVAQIALSLMLVVVAFLFVRTLHNSATVDAGFQTDGVLVLTADVQHTSATPEGERALGAELLERLRAIPSVESAAAVRFTPVTGSVIHGVRRRGWPGSDP